MMTVTEHTGETLEATDAPRSSVVGTEVDDHDELVEDEVLVEEISIDGMCGVY